MKEYFISIDYSEGTSISYQEIVRIAMDISTDDEYADYLKYVLGKAKKITTQFDGNIEDIHFRIHKTGCIIPFGEGNGHPYCRNFYTKVWLSLPDNIPKAQ